MASLSPAQSMRRMHLVELEDLDWWPVGIRDLATDYLGFMAAPSLDLSGTAGTAYLPVGRRRVAAARV